MSSKVMKKKRLKSCQGSSNLPTKEDDRAKKYLQDRINVAPGAPKRLARQLQKLPDLLLESSGQSSKYIGLLPKNDLLKSLTLPRGWSAALSADSSSPLTNDKHESHSMVKSPKSFPSFKRNKHCSFDNITDTFTSSTILSLRALSDVTSQKRCELSSWGLPSLILKKYQARGINTMFQWQVECLANRKILEKNKNLVYSAPTSAGKTLVSEFLVLKTVLERRKKVIFILPFVSVVREKMFYFQDLLSDSGVRVEGFMGGVAPAGGFSAVHVAIATIEKANSLVNRLMEDGDLKTLGAVVIDELHLIGDPSRGYLLELLLTKLRYMTLSSEHVNIQLIGMSATLPNLPLIADWLDAELYRTDFRPIPLNEQCKINNCILDSKFNPIRELEVAPDIVNDVDNIIQLCIETIGGGHGVLIFCAAKSWCEKLASQIAFAFFQLGRDNTPHGQILRRNMSREGLQEVLLQLTHCPIGLDSVLEKTVSFGVAFHHAGLTMDERDIIEGGFRTGSLKVLVATSTLSSGVNLPARRVIIRTPKFNGRLLDKLTYQQMIGRAGRMGKDTAGESILICRPNERSSALSLMTSSLEPITSCLESSGPLVRALLEAIASGVVRSPKDLDFYCRCTFVYKCDETEVATMAAEAVQFLIANEFLTPGSAGEGGGEERLVASRLGKACLSASIQPRDGLFLFEELQRARKCLVLDTELHVVYLVTPFSPGSQISQIDWMTYLELWKALSESERRVGQLVGVEERFLMSALRGVVKPGKALSIHRRFYTALALYDLVREVSLHAVCRKYNCCRGLLQSLQQSSSTFAGMVTNFCKELKWDCMELLFAQFQARLQFGVCRELLDLLRLPTLNGLRARSLFKHGITTAAELAVASPHCVEEALDKALPFESEKNFDGESAAEMAKRTKMRTVFITGKDGLTARDAAHIVINEARILVKNELGVRDVQWSQISSPGQEDPHPSSVSLASLRTPTAPRLVVMRRDQVDQPLDGGEAAAEKSSPSKSGDSLFLLSADSVLGDCPMMGVSSGILETTSAKHTGNGQRRSPSEGTESLSPSRGDATLDEAAESRGVPETLEGPREAGAPRKELEPPGENRGDLSRGGGKSDEPESVEGPDDRAIAGRTDGARGDFTRNREEEQEEELSNSSEDVVNVSDEAEATPRSLRSKLLEMTTRSLLYKEDLQMGPRSMDSEEKMEIGKVESRGPESFQVSDRAIDEIMRNIEMEERGEGLGAPGPGPRAAGEAGRSSSRTPEGSRYSSSLFSDSSFFDPQICSILEKNVIDPECFADFESSRFTPRCEGLDEAAVKGTSVAGDKDAAVGKGSLARADSGIEGSAAKGQREVSAQSTWLDDSWDRIKNQRLVEPGRLEPAEADGGEKANDSESPSMLSKSNARGHLRQLICSQLALSRIKSDNSKDKAPEIAPPTDPARSIARKRAYVKNDSSGSPIASVRTYNTRRPIIVPPSSNKSDSDDSVISSQILKSSQANLNKTRLKIDQKLVKSLRVKSASSKLPCSAPKLMKQNTEASPDKSESNANVEEDAESNLMFDSDDPVNCKGTKLGMQSSNTYDKSMGLKATQPVNVANSKRAFRLFRSEIEGSPYKKRRRDLAVAIATEAWSEDAVAAIGNRLLGIEERRRDRRTDAYVYGDKKMLGVVISWGVGSTYYMPFGNAQGTKVTIKERSNFLRDILADPSSTLRCFKAKEIYKMLRSRYEFEFRCGFQDPNAADWILNSESCYKSYNELAAQYYPSGLRLSGALEGGFGAENLGPSARAAAKALLAWYITDAALEAIERQDPSLLSVYKDVEMPAIAILADMELSGIGINMNSLQELSIVIKRDLTRIEERAFGLAGRKFNFYSTKEISQILGLNKKGRGGTSKMALKSCENPISNLVTLWRKLHTVQTKIVFPLLHSKTKNNRIRGSCITYTVTGRVSMHEPNLQTIPRDFKSEISNCSLSVRMAFVPANGNLLLSADFCQLELRILAHYSQDPVLCGLMHVEGDIFKNIAARLNNISDDAVDDDTRQRAKQLCYAMIYGMGTKSLAESLSVTESEAKDYLEGFMGTYKGIRVWLNSVSEQARVDGYVSTLANRRRLLPNITSKIPAVRSHAERQAVNTKVQGSAADIAKRAMVLIEKKLRERFSHSATPNIRKLRYSDADLKPRSVHLVLQIHDELLYEVNNDDLGEVASIVKESMENAYKLRVPLPVKMKVGTAWGDLKEYQIQER